MSIFALSAGPARVPHLRFASIAPQAEKNTVVTPAQYELTIQGPSGEGQPATVAINPDKVEKPSHSESSWNYWYPHPDTLIGQPRLYWTKNYIGTDEAFFSKGYRWGVSLGGTPEVFKRSALYLPGGGINLPNGKYLVAIKTDSKGNHDIILGKEARGIDKRVLPEFQQGNEPETNARQEIIGVSNHSMLISRGKPYSPETSDPDDFSASFAGEIEILNHQINAINDQTGQLFGPNGLVKPPKEAKLPDDLVMKQETNEIDKSAALKQAKTILETVTGSQGIRLIKVKFFSDVPPEAVLRQHRSVAVENADAKTLTSILQEKSVQELFDQLQVEPEKQERLLKALARNAHHRHAVLHLMNERVTQGTLKPEQGVKLAVELLETPEAIGLFVPESRNYISIISDNTKRKLVAGYNKQDPETRPSFTATMAQLKQHPSVIRFLTGQRIPGGLFKPLLKDLETANTLTRLVHDVFHTGFGDTDATELSVAHLEGASPILMGQLATASTQIRELSLKAKQGGAQKLTVVLEKNPFDGVGHQVGALKRNLKQLRLLSEKGANLFTSPGFKTNKTLEYLTDLYAFAHETATPKDVVVFHEVKQLLEAYNVDIKDLHGFAQKRFQDRWANNQIVAAYAMKSEGFRQFISDLHWVTHLPRATH